MVRSQAVFVAIFDTSVDQFPSCARVRLPFTRMYKLGFKRWVGVDRPKGNGLMIEGLKGKRILVSGASGFIGRLLCSKLLEMGAQVTGLSRQPQGNEINWRICDVTDEGAVRDTVFQVKPDVVFNLASEVNAARGTEWVVPMFHANLASTVYLMAAAADAGVKRFVQAGSQEEPDPAKGDVAPTSPYAAAKWAASAYGRMFHHLYGLGVVNLRVFIVYGPGQKDRNKLIPFCILESLAGRRPKIGSGTRGVDWVYIDDVVRAFLLAAVVPNVEGMSFEIGTGRLTKIREVVEMVVGIANPALTAEFSAEGRKMETEYAANYEATTKALAWSPRVQIEEGLKRTVQWYATHDGPNTA